MHTNYERFRVPHFISFFLFVLLLSLTLNIMDSECKGARKRSRSAIEDDLKDLFTVFLGLDKSRKPNRHKKGKTTTPSPTSSSEISSESEEETKPREKKKQKPESEELGSYTRNLLSASRDMMDVLWNNKPDSGESNSDEREKPKSKKKKNKNSSKTSDSSSEESAKYSLGSLITAFMT